jgi:hypothetical protein
MHRFVVEPLSSVLFIQAAVPFTTTERGTVLVLYTLLFDGSIIDTGREVVVLVVVVDVVVIVVLVVVVVEDVVVVDVVVVVTLKTTVLDPLCPA